MSLRGKEVRPLIEAELHERLSIMAEFKDVQLAELAARLLEKSIVAEWHEISVLLERSERLGKRWKATE
jgi:hypothetical protein